MDQKIINGAGCIENIQGLLLEIRPEKILVVSGKTVFSKSGFSGIVDSLLSDYSYEVFTDTNVNPDIVSIQKCIETIKKNNADFILALGGGSVLDTAKAAAILYENNGKLHDYVTGKKALSGRAIPLCAVPTTAGTGSESTHFSVVYIEKTKYSLAHSSMRPDYVFLDHELTASVPAYTAASSGMDCIAQGIESLWSVKSTEESRKFSRKALKCALPAIIDAVNTGDEAARENMILASNYAGKAINISQTTAAHAVSYPITSHFGLSHGHAVGLTLGEFIIFNDSVDESSLLDGRGIDFVKERIEEICQLLDSYSPEAAAQKISKIMEVVGLKVRLQDAGISSDDIELIIREGFNPQRVKNNPRALTAEGLRSILKRVY